MSNLNEEEQKYVEENQKQLQIAVDNCYLLFDPEQKQKPEEMFKFIENNTSDKIYIYMFIVNTCELVGKDIIIDGEVIEGKKLEPIHVICASEFYKSMNDDQVKHFSKLIKDAFFAPIDIKKSGLIQFIWIQLLDSCMRKIQVAQGKEEDQEEISSTNPETSSLDVSSLDIIQSLNSEKSEQGITQESETQPVDL